MVKNMFYDYVNNCSKLIKLDKVIEEISKKIDMGEELLTKIDNSDNFTSNVVDAICTELNNLRKEELQLRLEYNLVEQAALQFELAELSRE